MGEIVLFDNSTLDWRVDQYCKFLDTLTKPSLQEILVNSTPGIERQWVMAVYQQPADLRNGDLVYVEGTRTLARWVSGNWQYPTGFYDGIRPLFHTTVLPIPNSTLTDRPTELQPLTATPAAPTLHCGQGLYVYVEGGHEGLDFTFNARGSIEGVLEVEMVGRYVTLRRLDSESTLDNQKVIVTQGDLSLEIPVKFPASCVPKITPVTVYPQYIRVPCRGTVPVFVSEDCTWDLNDDCYTVVKQKQGSHYMLQVTRGDNLRAGMPEAKLWVYVKGIRYEVVLDGPQDCRLAPAPVTHVQRGSPPNRWKGSDDSALSNSNYTSTIALRETPKVATAFGMVTPDDFKHDLGTQLVKRGKRYQEFIIGAQPYETRVLENNYLSKDIWFGVLDYQHVLYEGSGRMPPTHAAHILICLDGTVRLPSSRGQWGAYKRPIKLNPLKTGDVIGLAIDFDSSPLVPFWISVNGEWVTSLDQSPIGWLEIAESSCFYTALITNASVDSSVEVTLSRQFAHMPTGYDYFESDCEDLFEVFEKLDPLVSGVISSRPYPLYFVDSLESRGVFDLDRLSTAFLVYNVEPDNTLTQGFLTDLDMRRVYKSVLAEREELLTLGAMSFFETRPAYASFEVGYDELQMVNCHLTDIFLTKKLISYDRTVEELVSTGVLTDFHSRFAGKTLPLVEEMNSVGVLTDLALDRISTGRFSDLVTAFNPYLWWRFNEDDNQTQAFDQSGNTRHGTISGDITYKYDSLVFSEETNKSFLFNDGMVVLEDQVALANSTYHLLVRPNSTGTDQTLLTIGLQVGFRVVITATNELKIFGPGGIELSSATSAGHLVFKELLSESNSNELVFKDTLSSSVTVPPMSQHSILLSFGESARSINLFLNGRLVDSYSQETPMSTALGMAVGATSVNNQFVPSYKGVQDDFFIVGRPLTTQEVSALYQATQDANPLDYDPYWRFVVASAPLNTAIDDKTGRAWANTGVTFSEEGVECNASGDFGLTDSQLAVNIGQGRFSVSGVVELGEVQARKQTLVASLDGQFDLSLTAELRLQLTVGSTVITSVSAVNTAGPSHFEVSRDYANRVRLFLRGAPVAEDDLPDSIDFTGLLLMKSASGDNLVGHLSNVSVVVGAYRNWETFSAQITKQPTVEGNDTFGRNVLFHSEISGLTTGTNRSGDATLLLVGGTVDNLNTYVESRVKLAGADLLTIRCPLMSATNDFTFDFDASEFTEGVACRLLAGATERVVMVRTATVLTVTVGTAFEVTGEFTDVTRLAITKSGNQVFLFVDGTMINSWVVSTTFDLTDIQLSRGCYSNLRYTAGVARYIADYQFGHEPYQSLIPLVDPTPVTVSYLDAPNQLLLQWQLGSNEGNYLVYREDFHFFDTGNLTPVAELHWSQNTYLDSNVQSGATYFYRVVAKSGDAEVKSASVTFTPSWEGIYGRKPTIAAIGRQYDAELFATEATGGSPTWALISGSIPPGLTLKKGEGRKAYITGVPSTEGKYDFIVSCIGDVVEDLNVSITVGTAVSVMNFDSEFPYHDEAAMGTWTIDKSFVTTSGLTSATGSALTLDRTAKVRSPVSLAFDAMQPFEVTAGIRFLTADEGYALTIGSTGFVAGLKLHMVGANPTLLFTTQPIISGPSSVSLGVVPVGQVMSLRIAYDGTTFFLAVDGVPKGQINGSHSATVGNFLLNRSSTTDEAIGAYYSLDYFTATENVFTKDDYVPNYFPKYTAPTPNAVSLTGSFPVYLYTEAFEERLTLTGQMPFTLSITDGVLPTGWSINVVDGDVLVAGPALQEGTYLFEISVTDGNNTTASLPLAVRFVKPLTVQNMLIERVGGSVMLNIINAEVPFPVKVYNTEDGVLTEGLEPLFIMPAGTTSSGTFTMPPGQWSYFTIAMALPERDVPADKPLQFYSDPTEVQFITSVNLLESSALHRLVVPLEAQAGDTLAIYVKHESEILTVDSLEVLETSTIGQGVYLSIAVLDVRETDLSRELEIAANSAQCSVVAILLRHEQGLMLNETAVAEGWPMEGTEVLAAPITIKYAMALTSVAWTGLGTASLVDFNATASGGALPMIAGHLYVDTGRTVIPKANLVAQGRYGSITASAKPLDLKKPTNLKVSAGNTPSQLTVEWDYVNNGAAGYHLYASEFKAGAFTPFTLEQTVGGSTYSATATVEPGVTVKLKVQEFYGQRSIESNELTYLVPDLLPTVVAVTNAGRHDQADSLHFTVPAGVQEGDMLIAILNSKAVGTNVVNFIDDSDWDNVVTAHGGQTYWRTKVVAKRYAGEETILFNADTTTQLNGSLYVIRDCTELANAVAKNEISIDSGLWSSDVFRGEGLVMAVTNWGTINISNLSIPTDWREQEVFDQYMPYQVVTKRCESPQDVSLTFIDADSGTTYESASILMFNIL